MGKVWGRNTDDEEGQTRMDITEYPDVERVRDLENNPGRRQQG